MTEILQNDGSFDCLLKLLILLINLHRHHWSRLESGFCSRLLAL